MTLLLTSFLKEQQENVEQALKKYLKEIDAPDILLEAMEYSLLAGGKRIRPAFVMAIIEALQGDVKKGLAPACALEMVHTYSLIHDDLPAMDNDDYRRGKLTSHKVFGEAMAILAGDALLTHAFSLLANERYTDLPAEIKVKMIKDLSKYAGAKGMVGGQVADVTWENKKLSLDELYYIHEHKTADMLICSVRFGCYVAGASPEVLKQLSLYAKHIGLAFQIQDDILDEVGDEEKLGKPVGSDRENQKNTFVTVLGMDGAKNELEKQIQLAQVALQQANIHAPLLLELTEFMISRES